jgi:hypothetical protein
LQIPDNEINTSFYKLRRGSIKEQFQNLGITFENTTLTIAKQYNKRMDISWNPDNYKEFLDSLRHSPKYRSNQGTE